MSAQTKIIWTQIDEAPALATYSLLPIVNAFTKAAGVSVETRDISLSGRVISNLSEFLPADQKMPDYLAELGELTLKRSKHYQASKHQRISSTIDCNNKRIASKRLQTSRLS